MTGFVLENIYFEHYPGSDHPESPERLRAIEKILKNYSSDKLKRIKARTTSEKEICLIHTKDHFNRIKATQGNPFVSLDPDTITSEKSFEAAAQAVGGVLNLIDTLFRDEIQNGFAFVRPPGHHAEINRAMGFCLFNNVAIGAAYAIKKHHLSKVLVLDIDLHHGNGTQQAFYNSEKVMYISTHQYPYYPGTGSVEEIGKDKGRGFNINLPLMMGADDAMFFNITKHIIKPIVLQYKPELILVSCGFDTFIKDPLGGMALTEKGYAAITQELLGMAGEISENRLIFVLEGGYSLEGISLGTRAILDELTALNKKTFYFNKPSSFDKYFLMVKNNIKEFWKI